MRNLIMFVALTVLPLYGLAAESIVMTEAFDKASYLPGHPVGLLVRMSNPSDNEVDLFWADQWPPPLRPGPVKVTGPGYLGYLFYEMRIDVADNSGHQVWSYPPTAKSDLLMEQQKAPEKVEQLPAKGAKEYRLRLPLNLPPGDYTLECRLPAVALKKGGEPIRLSGKLNLKIEDENEAGKPFAPELALEKKPDGFSIKCKLSPPRDVKMEVPFYKQLNCRIVVRDDQNRIVVDEIYQPNGSVEGFLAWTKPLEWSIDLPVEFYFTAGAGKYTVEFSYRDYALPKGERREKAPQDTAHYWGRYLSAEDLTKDPLIWNEPWTPVKGVWVTAVKKWDCEVTPEMAKAGKK